MAFSNYYFTPVNATDSTVTMRLTAANGATIDLDYKLLADNYLVNFSVKTKGMQKYLPSSTKSLQMNLRNDRAGQARKGFLLRKHVLYADVQTARR